MRRDHSWIVGILLAQSLGVSGVWIGGCSSSQPRGEGKLQNGHSFAADFDAGDPSATLESIAEREARRPSESARELVNRLMDGRLVEIRKGTPEYIKAHRSLEDVIRDALEGVEEIELTELPLIPQLAKGYVRARAALANEDYETAAGMFNELHQASPQTSEFLVGLGDAFLRAGDRLQASEAYLRAVVLGERETRVLVYGAMGIVDNPDRVIELTSMVWSNETTNDYAGRLLAGVLLGQTLIETGSYDAGAEVMGAALGMLNAQVARDPIYRRELVQLYTKRAERFASMGDAWMLLGDGERAVQAYEISRSLVGIEPRELMFRRVGADLLSGQSARAATTLLDWIDAHPGNDRVELQQQVAIVAEHPVIGSLIVDAVAQRVWDDSRPVSHRVGLLGMLLSMSSDVQQGVELLGSVDPSVVSPVSAARVLSAFEDRADRIDAAYSIIQSSSGSAHIIIPALIRIDGDAYELHQSIVGDGNTSSLMRRMIRLELHRPDLATDSDLAQIQLDSAEIDDTIQMIAIAREAALADRWDVAEACFKSCAEQATSMGDAQWFFFLDSLASSNQLELAFELSRERAALNADSSSDWIAHARMAQRLQRVDAIIEALERAIDLDPYNEGVYEQLISLRGPTGAAPDTEALRTVTRSLGQRLPESALVQLIRAHELAGAGASGEQDGRAAALINQSERLLLQVHEQHPWREIGIDLLLSIWATQASRGDDSALSRGLGWLDFQLGMMPGSVDLSGALARLMVLRGDEIGAEGFLDELHQRIPSRKVGRLHEGLIRSDESRRAEADLIALDRLNGLVSIEDGLERLERAGSVGKVNEFEVELYIPADDSWTYSRAQGLRLARVLGAVIESGTDQATADRVLELIDVARGQIGEDQGDGITAADALDQIEVVARPTGTAFSMDLYEQLVRRLRRERGLDNPDQANQILTIAMQSMMRGTSPSQALELLSRLSIDDDGMLDQVMTSDLASLMGQMGSAEDLQAAVTRFDDAGLLIEARDRVVEGLGTLNEGSLTGAENPDGVVADLVYSIAVVASFYDRKSDAREMYRLALSYDELHAWANNDLGYGMVEDGEDLEEAQRLLEIAHASEPGTASITDSLAWARYAMGIFEDELNDEGQVVRQGARSLLVEAVNLDDSNATIHDHLGDTLWMLARFDEAMSAWLEAEDRLRDRLTDISDQQTNARAVDMLRDELSLIRFKITDAESGRTPKVAPNSVGITVPERSDMMNGLDPTK